MLRNLIVLGCAGLLAIGLSLTGYAGVGVDTDNDGVPDAHDNCIYTENGPSLTFGGAGVSNCFSQQDGDLDGYGNICDFDINGNSAADINDISGDPAGTNGYVWCISNVVACPAEYDWNCNGGYDINDLQQSLIAAFGPIPPPGGAPLKAGHDITGRTPILADGSGLSCAALCAAPGFAGTGSCSIAEPGQCP